MHPESPNAAAPSLFTPGRFALLLGVLIAAAFPGVLFGGQSFVLRDYGLFSYPVAYYHRQCFWRGEIPLWNPLSNCGIPFLAQFNTLVLYPLSLIYLLLPMPWSLSFFCLVHLFLAGLGMYFLARRWTGSDFAGAVAGVVFAFNGLSLNFIMWPSHLAAFALIPWVIWLAEAGWSEGGRKLILAGLVAAMEILAGGPESILFTWIILFLLAGIHFLRGNTPRRTLVFRFVLIGLLTLAVAAPLVAPFLDLAAHSNRDRNFATADWAMPSWGWANFLLPLFQASRWHSFILQPGQYWTSSYYGGIAVICLALVALCQVRDRRVWLVGALFGVSIILALGDHSFVYPWLRKHIALMGLVRYPVKFVILSLWAIPLLAAFGLSYFERLEANVRPKIHLAIAGIMLGLIGFLLWFAQNHSIEPSLLPDTIKNALVRIFFLLATLGALHFFLRRRDWRKWSSLALLLLVWLDLLTHTPWQNPGVDSSVYDPATAQMKLKLNPEPTPGQSRLLMSPDAMAQFAFKTVPDIKDDYLIHRVTFLANCNLIDGLAKADGMFSLYLSDMNRLIDRVNAGWCNLEQVEDLMGVSQTTAPGKFFDWMARTNYLPLVTAGQKPVFVDDNEALQMLTQSNINLRQIVFLPKEAAGVVTVKTNTTAQVAIKDFQAQHITLSVEAKEASMVFISQSYYHNWKAYVDGKPVPLWRANAAFQTLETPGGSHEIKLAYEDKGFLFGAAISITALLGCGLAWLLRRRPINP